MGTNKHIHRKIKDKHGNFSHLDNNKNSINTIAQATMWQENNMYTFMLSTISILKRGKNHYKI